MRALAGRAAAGGSSPHRRQVDVSVAHYPYTTSSAVHRDPETGQYNEMFPRCGVLSRNENGRLLRHPTANRILNKHRAAGTRMPQAIVIGTHPAWELAGCYSHPHEGWWAK